MSVLRPEILLLLWLLPLVVALMLRANRRRRRLLDDWARPETLAAIMPRFTPGARTVKMILTAASLALAVAALSGVQYGSVVKEYERRGVNIMIVMDCSRSMLAQDVSPDRLQRAKREVMDLLDMLQGDKVGLVAFAGTAFLQCPLTLDYSGLHIFLNALSPDFLPVGGTDLALAIRTATESFRDKDGASRAMIIISDGGEEDEEALLAAREAVEAGVLVYCLGVGTLDGAPVPDASGSFMRDRNGDMVHARLQEELLKQVATESGGAYVRSVAGDEDLRTLYEKHILSDLAAEALEQGVTEIREDRFQWLLLGAMALLAAAMAIPEGASSRRSLWARLLPVMLAVCLVAPPTAWSSDRDDLVRQGMRAYEDQEFETARDAFLEASILEPDNPALLYDLGNAQYRLGNFQEAAAAYEQALGQLALDDGSAEPYDDLQSAEAILYNLGNTAYRSGDLPGAIDRYEQALALDPTDEDARRNLEFVRWMLEQQQDQQQNQDQQQQDQDRQEQQDQQQNQDQQDQQDQQNDQQDQQQNQQDQQQQDQGQQQQDQQQQDQDRQEQQDQQQNQQEQQQDQDRQEQQDQQDQQQQDQDQQQQDQDQQQDQGQQQQDQQQQDQDRQEPQDQQQEQQPQDTQDQTPPRPEDEGGDEQDQPAAMEQQDRTMRDTEVDEAVLNRLEDRPGRALMPRTRSRSVEEDW